MLTTEFGTPLFWEIAKLLVMFRSGLAVADGDAGYRLRQLKKEFMIAAALSTEQELDVYLDGFDPAKKQDYDDEETRRDVNRYLAISGVRS